MHVVEHDRHPTAIRDEAIHHLIDRGLNRRAPDPEARKRASPKALPEPLNRRRQVRPQPHRVAVGRVERHPDHRLGALHTPRPHQRRLAITHRRVQYRERGLVTEHLEQAPPAQRPRVNPGRHQLRLDDPRSRAIHLRRAGTHPTPPSFPAAPDRRAGERCSGPTTARGDRWTMCGASKRKTFPAKETDPGTAESQLCGQHVTAKRASLHQAQPPERDLRPPTGIAVRRTLAPRRRR